MNRRSLVVFVLGSIAAAASAPAQPLLTGGIAVVSDDFNLLEVVQGQPMNLGFPSSPGLPGNARCILWDPAAPTSLIVAGTDTSFPARGFVSRVTYGAGPAIVNTILAPTNAMVIPYSMGFDNAGTGIYLFDQATDTAFHLTLGGALTPLPISPAPWGTALARGTVDPSTGDLYIGSAAGTSSAIYRIPATGVPTMPSATMVGSTFLPANVVDLEFDPLAPGRLIVATSGALLALNTQAPTGFAQIATVPPGTEITALGVDQNGDFVFAGQTGCCAQPALYRVVNNGMVATPTLIATTAWVSTFATDLDVIGAAGVPFRIQVSTFPTIGNLDLNVMNPPPGTVEGFTLVSAATALPPGVGPVFGLVPDSLFFNAITSPAGTLNPLHWLPSGGVLPIFPLVLPPGSVPTSLYGTTWDWTAVAFGPGLSFLGQTQVVRRSW